MGKRVGLLAGLLVLALSSGAVAQEPSPEPPPWFGGRVEMPEHGFAVTLPDDWVAFVPGADIQAQVDALESQIGGGHTYLRGLLPAAVEAGLQLVAIEFSDPDARLVHIRATQGLRRAGVRRGSC